MSIVNSKNYANIVAVPSVKIPVGERDALAYSEYDSYDSTAAALNSADQIQTAIRIPVGARLKSVSLKSPGSVSCNIGVAGNTSKYASALTGGSAQSKVFDQATVEELLIITLNANGSTGVYELFADIVKY
jgi:hypothetical protein